MGIQAKEGLGEAQASRLAYGFHPQAFAAADLKLLGAAQGPSLGEEHPAKATGGCAEPQQPPELDQAILTALATQATTAFDARGERRFSGPRG